MSVVGIGIGCLLVLAGALLLAWGISLFRPNELRKDAAWRDEHPVLVGILYGMQVPGSGLIPPFLNVAAGVVALVLGVVIVVLSL